MDPDSVLINGKAPFLTTKNVLVALLGNPDKRFAYNISNHFLYQRDKQPFDSIYTYDKSCFLIKKEEVIPYVINFEKDKLFLTFRGEQLNRSFDLKKMGAWFPETNKLLRASGHSFRGYWEVNARKGELPDYTWYFRIYNETLTEIYFRPTVSQVGVYNE
jgi:hypothetical protein